MQEGQTMKIVVFAGTKVGWVGLSALAEAGADIDCVFVDDEHVHETEQFSLDIIKRCEQQNIPYKRNARLSDIVAFFEERSVDYLFCFGYRRMLPEKVVSCVRGAACSTHFSLLPKYRGFAPVNWAIINGEDTCGVSLFHMASEMDAGDVVDQREVPIGPTEYAGDVMENCLITLRDLLIENWTDFKTGSVKRAPQDHGQATYTCARNPEDGEIDWTQPTRKIFNLIRGLSAPFPGAYTLLNGQPLVIWSAEPYELPLYVGRIPGKVVRIEKGYGVVVLTGDGAVLLREVTYESEKRRPDQVIKSIRVTLGR